MQSQSKFVYKHQNLNSQNFRACMILSAVGDAMGYKNGDWQFNTSSKIIHEQMLQMTKQKGPLALKIDMSWKYSDDTVMQIATAEALIQSSKYLTKDFDKVCQNIARHYKICATKMSGRAPGKTCMKSIQILNQNGDNWNKIPYSDRGGGCGGAMRSSCIGLAYGNLQTPEMTIKISIEAGRITHHNPVGYLGSMVAAYFTYLAVNKIEPKLWVAHLLEQAIPLSEKYIKEANRQVESNLNSNSWQRFVSGWKNYAETRNLATKITQNDLKVSFPEKYGIIERQHFYKQVSIGRWAGATGFDSVLIAYDALLGSKGNWQEFCLRGILHGGDNDSTGAIGGAFFGAYYGLKNVPEIHYKQLEDSKKLMQLGTNLKNIASQI